MIDLPDDVRRRYGAYDTPPSVVRFMVEATGIKSFDGLRVLEPATGLAPFSKHIASLKGSWKDIYGVEVNPAVVEYLRRTHPELNVLEGDYLLTDFEEKFDLVIGNPPYGIIGSENHYAISVFKNRKKVYKKKYETWRGKYNIYGLFIEKGVRDLKDRGVLAYVIPASWMILDEFKELRRFLARSGAVEVYYLGRVFHGLNVVAVVLIVRKGYRGLSLYDAVDFKPRLIYSVENYDGGIIAFKTPLTETVEKLAKTRLGDHYLIRISPRSPEIKSLVFVKSKLEPNHICILNGKNLVGANTIDYTTCHSKYYVKPEDVPRIRKWFAKERVVVGHTKGGKLVVAVDKGLNGIYYAWTGDVYHLIPKATPPLSNEELAEVLNSKIMNDYVKQKYRDITPHTTKTQLENLPLLQPKDLETLISMGIS
ncbi:MAG: TaqI-like C-terminal specificity domain-containing protein [Thermosphaera sp.]